MGRRGARSRGRSRDSETGPRTRRGRFRSPSQGEYGKGRLALEARANLRLLGIDRERSPESLVSAILEPAFLVDVAEGVPGARHRLAAPDGGLEVLLGPGQVAAPQEGLAERHVGAEVLRV